MQDLKKIGNCVAIGTSHDRQLLFGEISVQ